MVAAAVIGGAVIAGGASVYAGSKAAGAQTHASDQATAEQQREFNQTRTDQAPWIAAGTGALNRLNAASTGDMSSFQASPNYNFTRAEGQRDLGNTFAARGGAFSGNALRALDQYNQQLASGQYNNWWGQQAGLAGVGQSATNTLDQAGQNTANNIAGNYLASGNARASGIANTGNAISGSVSNGLDQYMYFNRQSSLNNYGLDNGWASGANANAALMQKGYG